MKHADRYFKFSERLGIALPSLAHPWESYSYIQQKEILLQWEEIRGIIPDRIKEIECEINKKQAQLNDEEHFDKSCELNDQIAQLASIINDLQIWYRTDQDIEASSEKTHL